jgi:hypothetical protein
MNVCFAVPANASQNIRRLLEDVRGEYLYLGACTKMQELVEYLLRAKPRLVALAYMAQQSYVERAGGSKADSPPPITVLAACLSGTSPSSWGDVLNVRKRRPGAWSDGCDAWRVLPSRS